MEELERLTVEAYKTVERKPLVLVLDNVRSGLNVGSIFRSADAFGIARVHCCGITSVPPHREVLKSALGSTDTVAWTYETTTEAALKDLKLQGYTIAGVEQVHGSTPLNEFVWNGRPLALVFGNEVTGISDDVLDLCDIVLELTQTGTKHSLNVAVCAGVVMSRVVG